MKDENNTVVSPPERNETRQGDPIPFPLRLRSVQSTRQTFARVLREYGRGTISEPIYKSIVYGLSQYQSYLRLEADMELEKRLEAIEEHLRGGQ